MRGYRRSWLGPDEEEINLILFQHATAAGAQQYFDRGRAQVTSGLPSQIRPFTIPGLPAGYLALAGDDSGTAGALTTFRSGVYVVQLVCTGTEVDLVRAMLTGLALGQLRRLA